MFTPLLQALLAAAMVSVVTGSAISLTSSASSIKPLVSSNLTVECALHDTAPAGPAVGKRAVSWSDDVTTSLDNPQETPASDRADDENTVTQTSENVQFVTSMVVSRDGVDLATVSEHYPVRQLVPGFTVTGHLTNGAGERGKLTLTWPHPTQADAGTYRCDLDTLSAQGHTIVFSQTLKVMEQEVSISDLVTKLHTIELEKEALQKKVEEGIESENKLKGDMQLKMNTLELENAAQNKSLEDIKKSENQFKNDMQVKINALESDNVALNKSLLDEIKRSDNQLKTDLQVKINGLESKNTALTRSLESLRAIARVEPKVCFTAIVSTTKRFNVNQTVIYDDVITNEGGAYNSRTGVFTSPVTGFYQFELHATGNYPEFLALRHNRNIVITASHASGNDMGASSNSVTLRLSKGDVVDVIAVYTSFQLYYDAARFIQNTFSGYLIALA